ncbi:HTH_Tnp_Tc3_2 domain-containing protein [Trichonephila clavipes]|nr:HTH_Tnp_Tc3_2 domain-containing protein [Trichonephila clavipes]
MAGSDVVQSRRPIFDDFFQHLWPYIGNNTVNVVLQTVKRGVGTSGSERCHLLESQAQDALDRPVIEEDCHIVRNARVQPTASSAAILARVVPSLGIPCVFLNHTRCLAEGRLGSCGALLRVLPLTPNLQRLRLEWCRARENWTAAEWNRIQIQSVTMTIVFVCGSPWSELIANSKGHSSHPLQNLTSGFVWILIVNIGYCTPRLSSDESERQDKPEYLQIPLCRFSMGLSQVRWLSADEEAARKYPEKLAKIIKDGEYCAHQVFNADETGLF